MAIWKLEPTDLESPRWRGTDYVGVAIVRAQDEQTARQTATSRFARAVRRESKYQDSPAPSPWKVPELVTCTELNQADFDREGPAEVLDPLSWEPAKHH